MATLTTTTEIPGVELEAPARVTSPAVPAPAAAPEINRRSADRMMVFFVVCSVLFAAVLVARIFLPAVRTATSASTQNYQQAP